MITGAKSNVWRSEIGTLPLFRVKAEAAHAVLDARDTAMAQVTARAERADVLFQEKAADFVLQYLRHKRTGEASSEEITNACKAAGIRPPDDRAFGPVYMALARRRKIAKAGSCIRTKGHGTSGGNIWRLAE